MPDFYKHAPREFWPLRSQQEYEKYKQEYPNTVNGECLALCQVTHEYCKQLYGKDWVHPCGVKEEMQRGANSKQPVPGPHMVRNEKRCLGHHKNLQHEKWEDHRKRWMEAKGVEYEPCDKCQEKAKKEQEMQDRVDAEKVMDGVIDDGTVMVDIDELKEGSAQLRGDVAALQQELKRKDDRLVQVQQELKRRDDEEIEQSRKKQKQQEKQEEEERITRANELRLFPTLMTIADLDTRVAKQDEWFEKTQGVAEDPVEKMRQKLKDMMEADGSKPPFLGYHGEYRLSPDTLYKESERVAKSILGTLEGSLVMFSTNTNLVEKYMREVTSDGAAAAGSVAFTLGFSGTTRRFIRKEDYDAADNVERIRRVLDDFRLHPLSEELGIPDRRKAYEDVLKKLADVRLLHQIMRGLCSGTNGRKYQAALIAQMLMGSGLLGKSRYFKWGEERNKYLAYRIYHYYLTEDKVIKV